MPKPQFDLLDEVPTPGSIEAIEQGCSCPVRKNNHGKGINNNPNAFEVGHDCPPSRRTR